MTSTTNLGSPRHYRARKAIAVRNGNTQAAGEADALLRASKAARAIEMAVAGAPPLPPEILEELRRLIPLPQGA